MSKHIEKLKKQLTEIAEVVNSFQSEAVQVRVVDWLLVAMVDIEKADNEGLEILSRRGYKQKADDEGNYPPVRSTKRPGATKVLNQLLNTDFFDTPHSISSIATYCKDNFDTDFKTSELSGILLKLANEGKLKRQRSNENNRFEYVRV